MEIIEENLALQPNNNDNNSPQIQIVFPFEDFKNVFFAKIFNTKIINLRKAPSLCNMFRHVIVQSTWNIV